MPLHFRGTREELRAAGAYVKLMRCASSVSDRVNQRLRGSDLSENQFGVLEMLWHLGPLSPRQIGEKLFTSEPNVSKLLGYLEERAMIQRFQTTSDKRRKTVAIAKEGSRTVEGLFREYLDALVREMSVLSPAEQDELARLCRILGLQLRGAARASKRKD